MSVAPPASVPEWQCSICKYDLRGQMCQLKKCPNCGSLGTLEKVHKHG